MADQDLGGDGAGMRVERGVQAAVEGDHPGHRHAGPGRLQGSGAAEAEADHRQPRGVHAGLGLEGRQPGQDAPPVEGPVVLVDGGLGRGFGAVPGRTPAP